MKATSLEGRPTRAHGSSAAAAAVLALVACLAGCGAASSEDAGSACDVDPELVAAGGAVQPRRLSANGQNLNGIWQNGIQTNTGALNGVSLNGVSLNGVSLNGQNLNGINLGKGDALGGALGNELVGFDAAGVRLAGADLVGATIPAVLSDGRRIALEVRAFERSTTDHEVALYDLAYEGQSLCPNGERGMFVAGVWDERGARHDALDVAGTRVTATYSCTSGVIAKCVNWGYAPWRAGASLHQTCTRMARADYCGTGVSYTKNGTSIDVFDVAGVQMPTHDPAFSFEAAWNEHGAVCVSRTRYDAQTASGEAVMPSCWSALPRCTSLEEATSLGATIANASRPQSRRICE